MPVPQKDTAEGEAEAKFFLTATKEQRDKRAFELGYTDPISYHNAMLKQGVKLSDNPPDLPPIKETEIPIINLPPLDLQRYIPINSGRIGDPETMGMHLTDWHDCLITKSFNHEVLRSRAEHLVKAAIRIAELHRNMYPVNDLEILITGDMTQGENVYQGAKIGTVGCGAMDQVIHNAFPLLLEVIMAMKQKFLTVKVRCIPGNHGRYSKEAPRTSNWDLMLYSLLRIELEKYDIKVQVSNEFYMLTEIQGHRFFLFHGDQFKATMGVPWFAITKGLQSWYVTYDGFEYAVCGHFHSDHFLRLSSKSKIIMGASMTTDDPFTQEIIKTSSIPCQWVFGVHKGKGVTWIYPLVVDDAYFPSHNQTQRT